MKFFPQGKESVHGRSPFLSTKQANFSQTIGTKNVRLMNPDVESIAFGIGISDVVKEEQAQNIDSTHICMCRICGNNAFHHKLSEVGFRLAFT
ncbi:hypothetical protein E3N88_10433 [Mikania micrantha]|uniref:Uncharacterized protein n=1 Tax=Mikania micrantha TaxID=192012 RepID=A0A5N6PCC0_9ASTR|nr:hypothetical protein E3N88_10433 [Mikania micrantha]